MSLARFFFSALTLLLLLSGAADKARAASAEFAYQDPPRGQEWELLLVHVDVPPGGGTASVQDQRGGLEVSRSLEGAAADPSTGQARVLLPLPLLSTADLPKGAWPVQVCVYSAAGSITRENVSIERIPAGAAAFRIARNPTPAAADLPWASLTPAPPMFLDLADEEIIAAPAALFASCDAILIPDRLAPSLSADRVAALLSTGVRLVCRNDPATLAGNGVLGRLEWTRAAPDANLWITAAAPCARPRVVEPGLARARTLEVSAVPARKTITLVLLVPVCALAILLLARGLFRSRYAMLAAMIAALACLGLAAAQILRATTTPATQTIAWTTTGPGGNFTSLALTEEFTATSALFGQHIKTPAEPAELLYPLAASALQYFALHDASLTLDALSDDGLRRVSQLELTARPRATLVYARRSANLFAGTVNLTTASMIEAGYITPPAPESAATPPVIFAEWASARPKIKDALLTWYELRFAGNHRYFLKEPAEGEPLTFVDLGIPAPASRP